MPIIARLGPDPTGPPPYLDTRQLSLRTLDGTDEQLFADVDWMILPGIMGLDLPPRDVIVETSPGLDGGWLREIRIKPREVFLPMLIASDVSHTDFLDRLDRLRGFFDYQAVADLTAEDGTLFLVADSVRGERHLRVVYLDGLEGEESGVPLRPSKPVGVRLLAVDPYWRSTDETVLEFSDQPGEPFLSTSDADPWPRALSPSVSLGTVTGLPLFVPGKVPVWPTVEVDGPASSTVLSWPDAHVEIGPVAPGEHLVMVTDPRRRSVRVDGEPAWSRVGPAPKFARLPPGETPLGVTVTSTSEATRVRVRFFPAFPTAW